MSHTANFMVFAVAAAVFIEAFAVLWAWAACRLARKADDAAANHQWADDGGSQRLETRPIQRLPEVED